MPDAFFVHRWTTQASHKKPAELVSALAEILWMHRADDTRIRAGVHQFIESVDQLADSGLATQRLEGRAQN